jgi:adenine-specific DNA-methyltransferase
VETLFKKYIGEKSISDFPQTRYQGSKFKLMRWIWENISFLDFDKVADLFGGTAAVSYLMKIKGKAVIYNDLLKSNYFTGLALIENSETRISKFELGNILKREDDNQLDIISSNFQNIYYTYDENNWLDRLVQNIYSYFNDDLYKKSILLWSLFQACIIKRPYNLFHRKNLYIRTNNVKRSFGNKTTWDKSFEYYFKKFVLQINHAIFDNKKNCQAFQRDALDFKNDFDLVYIDTPYVSDKGVGVDYFQFYHFLEGICDYFNWKNKIDYSKKHRPLYSSYNRWVDRNKIRDAFLDLISHYRNSHIVISYRSDGIPSVEDLIKIVKQFKKNSNLVTFKNYKYVLSTNDKSDEILIIGWD